MNILQEAVQLSQDPNLDIQLVEGKKVSKKHLINTLNYINFQDGTILINLKHQRYSRIVSLQAKPQPCLGDSLDCLWAETAGLKQKLKLYKFLHFVIADGQKMILVKPDVKRISEEGISFDLPETCYEICSRKVKRHLCEGIHVELIQNGVKFHGSLLDFSAVSFRVEASAIPPQSFQWINPESPVFIIFKNRQEILYSGECTIIRQTLGKKTRAFILEPLYNQASRFRPKECRSPRHKLSPSLNIIFEHPLTRNLINLKVEDISGSGFSVEEHYDNSVLLPGMVIPQMELEFANTCRIYCRAQVVYRNVYKTEEGETYVKSGIAILDMNIQDQVKLSSLLHQMTDRKSYVCTRVDLNALWKFFFEAGFVYPKKYASMHTNKEKFKETYEKLYIRSPKIAKHFIYQDKGIIQGHISMVRFYENTWLIHHHAASRSGHSKAGLAVLNQVGRYVNDFRCLYSTHMDFLICYFRPDNRFPNRVFGGFTRELNKPEGSSIDPFAYFNLSRALEQKDLSEPWVLTKTQPDDLLELESFYEYESRGLMLHALDLEPDLIDHDELSKEYQRLGFKRERHLFSLKKDSALKAVIMVTTSDVGLNLSNLTNCIHVVILDSDDLPLNTFYSSLSRLLKYYEQDEVPVLLYPVSYAETRLIPCEKIYNLWVINTQYGDAYLKYVENLVSHTQRDISKLKIVSSL